jgi:hypothetical protein
MASRALLLAPVAERKDRRGSMSMMMVSTAARVQ